MARLWPPATPTISPTIRMPEGITSARATERKIMKLVDRLIMRELLGPILNSIFMFLIVLFATAFLSKLTDLLVKGEPLMIVIKMAIFSLPMLMNQTLPMSLLLGTLTAVRR